jgi:hypothetical protein
VLSIRFRYYMSAHEGPSSYSKSRILDQVCGNGKLNLVKNPVSGELQYARPAVCRLLPISIMKAVVEVLVLLLPRSVR